MPSDWLEADSPVHKVRRLPQALLGSNGILAGLASMGGGRSSDTTVRTHDGIACLQAMHSCASGLVMQ